MTDRLKELAALVRALAEDANHEQADAAWDGDEGSERRWREVYTQLGRAAQALSNAATLTRMEGQ